MRRFVQGLMAAFFILGILTTHLDADAQAAPQINSVDHASMPVGGRQCVNGTGFGDSQGSSTVTLNGTAMNAFPWIDYQICFTVPGATAVGTASVQVATAAGSSNVVNFTLAPPPAISSISPSSGTVGTQVTLTGTNFGMTQGSSTVSIGPAATVSSWSDTQIVFTVPQGAYLGQQTVWVFVDSLATTTTFYVASQPAILELAINDTPLQVNLSSPQVLDWIHWGRTSGTIPDRKGGITPLISDYTAFGGAQPSASSGNIAFSWADGNHPQVVSEANQDVETFIAGGGFQLTVPADSTPKTLNLYAEVFFGQAVLQATLSDGSAAAINDQSVTDLDFASKVYSIDFRAASPGQTLTVTLSAAPGSLGGVGLQAATLTPHLPVVNISNPIAGQSFAANSSVNAAVNAIQFDSAINDVTAIGSDGTVMETASSPLNATWGPLAGGHYTATATATDAAGLNGTSIPVEFDVIGQGGTLSVSTAAPPLSVDLSFAGSADWIVWGTADGSDIVPDNPGMVLARKQAVQPQVSTFKAIGNHPITASFSANVLSFSDTTQNFSSSGSQLQIHGKKNGFELRVPADTTARTLSLYVAEFLLAQNLRFFSATVVLRS